jgi:hypothetical protein
MESLNTAIDWIKLHARKCAASTELEDLKAAVELAKERVGQAKTAGAFLKGDSRTLGILNDAEKKLGEFGRVIGGIQDICKDVDALVRVHSAVRILRDDDIIYRDPEKATRAFGQIFVGFGRFCRFLPPLKSWGNFLKVQAISLSMCGMDLSQKPNQPTKE